MNADGTTWSGGFVLQEGSTPSLRKQKRLVYLVTLFDVAAGANAVGTT